MNRPVLVCQGFQRAFIDVSNRMFSISASVRRGTCEQVLKYARASGWITVHAFLDTGALEGPSSASIDGFAPRPTEPYFQQKTLSAFGASGFLAKLESLPDAPIFLISFAGLSAVAATFFDGLERGFPIFIVGDAIADVGRSGVSEQERLAAMETIARAHSRYVASTDFTSAASGSLPGFQIIAAGRRA